MIGIGLALKSLHCNNTLNNNNKPAQILFATFSSGSFIQKKSKLMLLNHRKMKAIPAINEML